MRQRAEEASCCELLRAASLRQWLHALRGGQPKAPEGWPWPLLSASAAFRLGALGAEFCPVLLFTGEPEAHEESHRLGALGLTVDRWTRT